MAEEFAIVSVGKLIHDWPLTTAFTCRAGCKEPMSQETETSARYGERFRYPLARHILQYSG